MKKGIMKLCAIVMLPVMLLVGGCSKEEIPSYVGVYEFEYAAVESDGEIEFRMNSCDVLENLEESGDIIDTVVADCKELQKITLELTKDGYFKITKGENTQNWKYLIDETGNFLVSPLETEIENSKIEGLYYDSYTFENARFYMSEIGHVQFRVIGVYAKTNG